MSMKFNPLIVTSIVFVICMTGITNSANAVDQVTSNITSTISATDATNSQFIIPPANSQGQQRYIVRFKEPAVAMYNGTGQLAAIPRNADNSIQTNAPATTSYVTHLKTQQNDFLNSISNTLNRTVTAKLSFQYAYNGMAIYLSPNEIASVTSSAQIAEVILDKDYILNTDAGPKLIGASIFC